MVTAAQPDPAATAAAPPPDPLLDGLTRDTATNPDLCQWRPDGLPAGLLAVGTNTPTRWPGTQSCGDCGCLEVAHHRRRGQRTFCTATLPTDGGELSPCRCEAFALPRWLCLIPGCTHPAFTGRDSREAQDACTRHQNVDPHGPGGIR